MMDVFLVVGLKYEESSDFRHKVVCSCNRYCLVIFKKSSDGHVGDDVPRYVAYPRVLR